LEVWEKVIINPEGYEGTVHAVIACIDCHAGVNSAEKEVAHQDLIADPSEDPQLCGECHPSQGNASANSLHYTLQGYDSSLQARSEPDAWPHLEEMQSYHCDSCHATCGQCHLSQPTSVGGGLLDGHAYVTEPPMTRTCTACHGSRVGNEFLGKNEGILADVHFRQGRMGCIDCHTGQEMHGMTAMDAEHRYDGPAMPACLDCHPEAAAEDTEVLQHQLHGDKLSCQVCHSTTYKNCDSCHVQQTEEGVPFFETAGSYMTFLIGKNPLQSEARPYEYVPLRHVPIDTESFLYYGADLLTNFDALPTWRYATPHNIQRQTPQNESCGSCHGNADVFLTIEKVYEFELEANQSVIVEDIPPLMTP
jgi:thiosulfate/3-mercaptopyruvate sulfurtransferase